MFGFGFRSVFVAIIAAVCLCNVASAVKHITSVDDFMAFANDVKSGNNNYDVVLDTDLDFKSSSLTSPVGVDSDGLCHAFKGNFDGQGHVLKNLKMDCNKFSYGAALFCSLGQQPSTIKNLVFDKSCEFSGTIAAAVAVEAEVPDIINVTVNAQITGKDTAGGYIGQIVGKIVWTPILNIKNNKNNAVIKTISSKSSCVGGFIGLMGCYSSNWRYSANITNNEGKYNIGSECRETALGGVVGCVRKGERNYIEIRGNKLSVTAHTGRCNSLTSGGPIGAVQNSPEFWLNMLNNSFEMTDCRD